MRKVGILGYGHLGKYLADHINKNGKDLNLELAFVWNRTPLKPDVINFDHSLICHNILDEIEDRKPDIVVEVSHPEVTKKYASEILKHSDYMIGSPSALSSPDLEEQLRSSAINHGLYIPSGALWGAQDIRRLDERGLLEELEIEMEFHPSSLKLLEPYKSFNESVKESPMVVYNGPIREICKFAPNNVNTMACGAIAARSLGFDGSRGKLISNPALGNYHRISIQVKGRKSDNGQFHVSTIRMSPSGSGLVTSKATYASFLASLIGAKHQGPGVHLC